MTTTWIHTKCVVSLFGSLSYSSYQQPVKYVLPLKLSYVCDRMIVRTFSWTDYIEVAQASAGTTAHRIFAEEHKTGFRHNPIGWPRFLEGF